MGARGELEVCSTFLAPTYSTIPDLARPYLDPVPTLSTDQAPQCRENASAILDAYLDSVGGRDAIFAETAKVENTKKRGRKSVGESTASKKARKEKDKDHPATLSPPASAKAAKWKPPPGNWDDQIREVDAAQDETTGKLVVYLTWDNGQKTKHPTETVYKRCPQKVWHSMALAPFWGEGGKALGIPMLTISADAPVLRTSCANHRTRPG